MATYGGNTAWSTHVARFLSVAPGGRETGITDTGGRETTVTDTGGRETTAVRVMDTGTTTDEAVTDTATTTCTETTTLSATNTLVAGHLRRTDRAAPSAHHRHRRTHCH